MEISEKKWWSFSVEEYLKTDKRVTKEDLEALRNWMNKQPHLPNIPDEQVLVFLAACGYSIEMTKHTIDLNYTMRTKYPKMWKARDIDDPILDNLRSVAKLAILPHKKGRPVVLSFKVLPMDPSFYDVELLLRIGYMLQDLSHLLLGPCPNGYIFIVDMDNISLSHILHNPITSYATGLKYAQEASCCVIKGLHFMNGGPILETFLNMLKPFITPQVWKMIKPHEKTTGLEKYLEPTEIPKDYHGEAPSIADLTDKYYDMLREYRPWFIKEETLRVKEENRPAGNTIADGLQGSFRKLDLD